MRMKKNIKLLGLVILCVATVAHATGDGMYFGLLVGKSKLNNKSQVPSGASTKVTPSNTGIGAGLILGYQVSQYAAMELGYTYYTPSKYNASGVAGVTSCNTNLTIKENTVSILGKGILPLFSTGLDVFAKAGFAVTRQTMSGGLVTPSSGACGGNNGRARTGFAPAGAIGVSYDITQNWVVDFSYNAVAKSSGVASASLAAIGFTYHIVDKLCGQFLC